MPLLDALAAGRESVQSLNTGYLNEVKAHGGIRPAARALGVPESTLRGWLKREQALDRVEEEVGLFVSTKIVDPIQCNPMADRTRYFILTSAQDGTEIHEDFWQCLQIYAAYLENCEVLIGGYTYNKKLFENHDKRADGVVFHPDIDPFITHDRYHIGDNLAFCCEDNALPTAVTPLTGMDAYTRSRSGIFPHAKVQLRSVATRKTDLTKILMTTGSVTRRNYIRKRAGIKAAFDHIIGAVLVELHPDGSHYCRHLLATNDTDGSFYDLDRRITSSEGVTEGNRVEALVYGDIHHEELDPDVALATWGYDTTTGRRDVNLPSLIGYLRPHYEVYHDLSDFRPRNHHNIKDHHHRLKTYFRNTGNVMAALRGCAGFLREVARDECMSAVIQSNHDNALLKWVKTAEPKKDDPENYEFWLESELFCVRQIRSGLPEGQVFEHTLRMLGCPDDVPFVYEDEPFTICGDIECGMHGHLGPNGSRGSAEAFHKLGPKTITGHTHSPMIRGGAYIVGVSAKLDLGYNLGPSSWSHTHCIVYPNGKRTLITMMNGRWYAPFSIDDEA